MCAGSRRQPGPPSFGTKVGEINLTNGFAAGSKTEAAIWDRDVAVDMVARHAHRKIENLVKNLDRNETAIIRKY